MWLELCSVESVNESKIRDIKKNVVKTLLNILLSKNGMAKRVSTQKIVVHSKPLIKIVICQKSRSGYYSYHKEK